MTCVSMYDGIFDDVEHVKKVLASRGHEFVDETLVFELLEDLKQTSTVVQILLGKRVRPPGIDSFDSQLMSDRDCSLEMVTGDGTLDLLNSNDSNSSDCLAILEHNEENKTSPDSGKGLVDLTDERETLIEPKEDICGNVHCSDTVENKPDDADANNSATDSDNDGEMDGYYMQPYLESEESEGFGESDVRPVLSPILRLPEEQRSPIFENQNNYTSNLESAENRMDEMLEENNNDPNNNLEDIQVLEENSDTSAMSENLEMETEPACPSPPILEPNIAKCNSPKPGCSKDSYYADSDFCILEKTQRRETGILEISASDEIRRSPKPEIIAIQDEETYNALSSKQALYRKIERDAIRIRKLLPDITLEEITSKLEENAHATNRVELTLWDLLPTRRPLPILNVKRKLNKDNCPSPNKKQFIPEESCYIVEHVNTSSAGGLTNKNSPSLKRNNILTPAKLKLSDTRNKNIIHPPKLVYSTTSLAKRSSILKPSKLQHLDNGNGCMKSQGIVNDVPKNISDDSKSYNSHRANRDHGGAVAPYPKMISIPYIPPKLVDKPRNSRLLNAQTTDVVSKKPQETDKSSIASKVAKMETLLNPVTYTALASFFEKTDNAAECNSQNSSHSKTQSRDINPISTTVKSQGKVVEPNIASTRTSTIPNIDQSDLEDILVLNGSVQEIDNQNEENEGKPITREDIQLSRPSGNVKVIEVKQKILVLPKVSPGKSVANPSNDIALSIVVPKEIVLPSEAKTGKQDSVPPKELFNPLINMFPAVDPTYIGELCCNAKLDNQTLESLVEILLHDGVFHPRIINLEPEPLELNPDSQYENLRGIFPDAYPEYLRGIAERYYKDPEAMKTFVQSKLEHHDYPTMADYLKKMKITEQIRQYTIDFSAEKFLEIFPDPFKHFENPNRKYTYNVIAFEFLKCHFRSNKVVTIQREYRYGAHLYHISLAAKKLEAIGPDMKSKRSDKTPPTEDIPLLQEFAFIQHKAELREYLKAQRRLENQEFKMLKERNELLECQCCFDTECMPSKCLSCSEGHLFCKSCIKLGTATKIGDGRTQFPCFVECNGEFTLPVLQKVLEPTTFSILLRKRQEEEVKAAGLEGLVSCPFCHFASIPPPEDKVFKCLNVECMKETCRLCKELNHVPLRCDEVVKGEEARHYLEEKMTEALVRKCYKCSRPFFKEEGCNKMSCVCGAMTCYICGEPVTDYKHFNGQGSERTDLCPLWSDNNLLNAQTVRVVAEAAEKEILKKNPNLKLDAKALMPSLPQATKGPHQDIPNAHILPVHTRRA